METFPSSQLAPRQLYSCGAPLSSSRLLLAWTQMLPALAAGAGLHLTIVCLQCAGKGAEC